MHGISVHYVNNELDGGPIITQGALKIDPTESEAKLINRIHKIEHAVYPKVIADIVKGYISLEGNQVKFEPESHFGKIIWNFLMYKYHRFLFLLIGFDLSSQEIPDCKGEYVFTNSRLSMTGIRELITHEEDGKRTLQFNAKFLRKN